MATLTVNHSIEIVNNFITDVSSNNNSYYCFVGQGSPWRDSNNNIDETAIPTDLTSILRTEQSVYQNLAYGKKIGSTDISVMIPRHNWTNGSIYDSYDNLDPDLYSKEFFVVTDNNDVYKCIYNGNNAPSTIKPTITQTKGTFTTSDGYIWKYMFTCETGAYNKFQTVKYIPVTVNNAVVGNATPGAIENIEITNSGNNYQVFEEGFLQTYVNNSVVQLPSTSAPYDNYYTDSSIYLKAGFGAGQIRQITSYSGSSKLLSVSPAFNLYENLKLTNINGQLTVGDLVLQSSADLFYYHNTGYFNTNDTMVQTETGANGIIRSTNSTCLKVELQSSNNGFSTAYPVYNTTYAPVKKNGLVSITSNSLYVNTVSGTYFTNDYSVGSFIRVGENSNTNIRRITAVNSTVITVETVFNNVLSSANNYLIPSAISPESITTHNTTGSIVYTNLNSADIVYTNTQPSDKTLTLGETVVLVDASNTSQNANGIVSYISNTNIILSNVLGTMASNLYLYGMSSSVKTFITKLNSYPNITVSTEQGGFQSGIGIFSTTPLGVSQGNAFVVSLYSSPNELTEYIISPAVNIAGDGTGALAYCTVDLSENNVNRSITNIVVVNTGIGYTNAVITISANSLYGNNATLTPSISPVKGHGADPYVELGGVYVGISKTFDTALNESYKLPLNGSYRTIGILKNPTISNGSISNTSTFNQYGRIAFSGNTSNYNLYEYVVQANTGAKGRVINSTNNIDVIYTVNAAFSVGETIINANTGANGIIVYANNTSKYLQISGVSNATAFSVGDTIKNPGNTKISVINNIYNVLVLDDVSNTSFTVNGNVVGATSNINSTLPNSEGICSPNLTRNSGKVLYLETMTPFTKSTTSTEQVKLIIKF